MYTYEILIKLLTFKGLEGICGQIFLLVFIITSYLSTSYPSTHPYHDIQHVGIDIYILVYNMVSTCVVVEGLLEIHRGSFQVPCKKAP